MCTRILLLLLLCGLAPAAFGQVLGPVRISQTAPGRYTVEYQLDPQNRQEVDSVELRILRRRGTNVQTMFTSWLSGPQIVAVSDGRFRYYWVPESGVVRTGDALQARVQVVYRRPAATPPPVTPPENRPRPNTPPVADAGRDLSLQLPLTASIVLDGSRSSDTDGRIVLISWRQTAGPNNLTLLSPDSRVTGVIGPLQQGTYRFELTVRDERGGVATDEVAVQVRAAAPAQVPPVQPPTQGVPPARRDTVRVATTPPARLPAVTRQAPPRLKGGPANAIVNLLVPGLGHYFVSGDYAGNDRKAGSFLITALYGGAAGGAFIYKLRSDDQYRQYRTASEFREYQYDANGNIIGVRGANALASRKLLDDANISRKNSLILAGVAGGILAGDFLFTLVRGARNARAWKEEYGRASIHPFMFTDGARSTAGIKIRL